MEKDFVLNRPPLQNEWGMSCASCNDKHYIFIKYNKLLISCYVHHNIIQDKSDIRIEKNFNSAFNFTTSALNDKYQYTLLYSSRLKRLYLVSDMHICNQKESLLASTNFLHYNIIKNKYDYYTIDSLDLFISFNNILRKYSHLI